MTVETAQEIIKAALSSMAHEPKCCSDTRFVGEPVIGCVCDLEGHFRRAYEALQFLVEHQRD